MSLVIAALMWTFMTADMSRALAHENIQTANELARLNHIPSISLLIGATGFFASVGASGWIASRRLGVVTTGIALAGVVAFLMMVSRFADL